MDFNNQENDSEEDKFSLPTEFDSGFINNLDDDNKGFILNQDITENEPEYPSFDGDKKDSKEDKKEESAEKKAELERIEKEKDLAKKRARYNRIQREKEKKRRIIIISVIAALAILSTTLIIRLLIINN